MADPTMPRRQFLQAATGAAIVSSVSTPATAQTTRAADLIFKNGKIITVDPAFTIAQAIAVAGERILAVGTNDAMAAHESPTTRVIDLKGKPVMPGLTDGHAHMDREALRTVFPSLGRV